MCPDTLAVRVFFGNKEIHPVVLWGKRGNVFEDVVCSFFCADGFAGLVDHPSDRFFGDFRDVFVWDEGLFVYHREDAVKRGI